jgi:hypothetical protein
MMLLYGNKNFVLSNDAPLFMQQSSALASLSGLASEDTGNGHADELPIEIKDKPAAEDGPMLSLPTSVTAAMSSTVQIPVSFTANGHNVSSVGFAIQLPDLLGMDTTDADRDGIADAIAINAPGFGNQMISYNESQNRVYFTLIASQPEPPFATLSDGDIVTMTLQVGAALSETLDVELGFTEDPAASFGTVVVNDDGSLITEDIPGGTVSKNVTIHVTQPSDDDAQSIVLVASSNEIPADGRSTVDITITVRDAKNNPLANQSVDIQTTLGSFLVDNQGVTTSAISSTTDASGTTVITLQSVAGTQGTAEVTAQRGDVQAEPIHITFGPYRMYLPSVMR